MPLFVILYDETQQICPVLADSPEEARQLIGKLLGKDVGHCPVYRADSDEDVEVIICTIEKACADGAMAARD